MMTTPTTGIKRTALITVLALASAAAVGGDERHTLSTAGARVSVQPEAESSEPGVEGFEPALPYGTEGTEWILVGGGAAYDFKDSTDLNLHVAYSRFLVDDVEFMLELGGWYHAQEGDDAGSINPVLEFRWHFYNEGDTSLFLNAGVGVYAATDNVPFDGSGAGFTPRAGIGVTHRLGDSANRIIAGLRWHHISNARISGEDRNPSRDAPMLYVQIAFPF